ncbi:MAG TPA: hypothetical protein VKB88_06555 [Bryobacteraceae bacterium]|nr:hypothetical protein [Bryobacteraceae bacterium]
MIAEWMPGISSTAPGSRHSNATGLKRLRAMHSRQSDLLVFNYLRQDRSSTMITTLPSPGSADQVLAFEGHGFLRAGR